MVEPGPEHVLRTCDSCGAAVEVHQDSDAAHGTRLVCELCVRSLCRYCGNEHPVVPDDLCLPARRDYNDLEALGRELGLSS